MVLRDCVLAVVTAQLREERDGLLCALLDEFAEQPRQGMAKGRALVPHVGGKRSRAEMSVTNHRV